MKNYCYVVSTFYQLLEVIVLNQVNEADFSELLLFERIYNKKIVEKLKLEFGYIASFTHGTLFDDVNKETILLNILEYFDQFFKEKDIHEFSDIYTSQTFKPFGVYLAYNQIPHIYMEDASGCLNLNPFRWPRITHVVRELFYDLGLDTIYQSQWIKKIVCDLKNELIELKNDNRIFDLSIASVLKTLPWERKKALLRIFGVDYNQILEYAKEEEISLLLTEWFVIDKKPHSVDDRIPYMYKLICEKYKNEKTQLIIKPHPGDYVQYNDYFQDALILDKDLPVELLNCIDELKIKEIITLYSTAINNLKDLSDCIICISNRKIGLTEAINNLVNL